MLRPIALMLFCSLVLTGCTNYVRSDVTRFYSPQGLDKAKTFVFLPSEAQFNSLEYKRYGDFVTNEMVAKGFRLVSGKSEANYGVKFNYGSDNGRTVIQSDPIFGTVGVGTGTRGSGVNVGVSTVFGGRYGGVIGSDIDARTEYSRQFTLNIIDLKTNNPVFEGRVISRGGASSFAPVSQCLIQAMFKDFLGENGGTETVRIDVESCAQ